jgi:hypothetical protein
MLSATSDGHCANSLDLMVGTIPRCPITRAIKTRTGMTGIERCSLSPRSHPLVDSASGQSWPAITVQSTGICSPGRTITISLART